MPYPSCFAEMQSTVSQSIASSTSYSFQSETVWDKLNIAVEDFHGHFRVRCQSDNAVNSWMLAKSENGEVVSSSDKNPDTNFQIDVNAPFTDYELTVMVNNDTEEIPMVVNLKPDKDNLWVTPTPVFYTPFKNEPDRPYNTLVKNLYDQAGQAFTQGDQAKAIEFLKKALHIDATEPQVLAFLSKIQPSASSPASVDNNSGVTSLLAQAQQLEGANKKLEALKLYLAVLKLEPRNKKAQASVDRIQGEVLSILVKKLGNALEVHDAEASQSVLGQIKKINPNDKRIAGWQSQIDSFSQSNAQSRKSKADEAYNLGLDSYRKDDFSSAKEFWEETLQIDPSYLQAQQNLDRLNQDHPGL
jgi:tetratricopeptide (TPR) repeat protein